MSHKDKVTAIMRFYANFNIEDADKVSAKLADWEAIWPKVNKQAFGCKKRTTVLTKYVNKTLMDKRPTRVVLYSKSKKGILILRVTPEGDVSVPIAVPCVKGDVVYKAIKKSCDDSKNWVSAPKEEPAVLDIVRKPSGGYSVVSIANPKFEEEKSDDDEAYSQFEPEEYKQQDDDQQDYQPGAQPDNKYAGKPGYSRFGEPDKFDYDDKSKQIYQSPFEPEGM
jgi:hypothetical protein